MMTKHRWLVIRDLEEIPLDVFYDYYKERGGIIDGMMKFVQHFVPMCMGGIVSPSGLLYKLSYQSAVDNLNHYYNKKFADV